MGCDFKLTIVTPSRSNDESKLNDFKENIIETCGCEFKLNLIGNEVGNSLSTIYNEALEEADTDIVVFVHDDVEFLKEGWGEEIVKLFNEHEEYGIIGVAGSSQFDETASWWTYQRIYGQVLHKKGLRVWLCAYSPLIQEGLKEVCVVDGLFMAVHKKRITSTFDEDFKGFNHYDTSFCLANYIDGKCKIGVTTNVKVAHKSIGETKKNWFENRELLNSKYKEHYPINIEDIRYAIDINRINNERFEHK